MRIDLNSDLGEGFGDWRMGDDAAMLSVVSSANIACGFHAGDPEGILKVLRQAAERGVQIGAHIGYRDLFGFGRRDIAVSPDVLQAETLYQIGALQALAHAAGTSVRYVKPHGALYNRMAHDLTVADAVISGIQRLERPLPLMALAGAPVVAHARAAGLTVICEAFADRAYLPDGQLMPRGQSGAVLHDPDVISERMLRLVASGTIAACDGTEIAVEAHSICVHGDNPAAVAIAKNLRRDLEAAGVQIRAFDV